MKFTALSLFLFICCHQFATAQSLIAGIPNAAVAHKGHLEFTHESQFNWWEKGFKWNSFNFICYGLNDRTEVTVAFNNLSSPASNNLTLGVGFKRLFPILPKTLPARELKFTFGTNALVSIDGRGLGFWSYGHLSGRLPLLRTRLTAGVSYGTEQAFGFRSFQQQIGGLVEIRGLRPFAFMGGVEQPLVNHLSLIADWFSGTHDLAALIVAGQYDVKHITYIAGFKRANNLNSGTNALIVELMFRF